MRAAARAACVSTWLAIALGEPQLQDCRNQESVVISSKTDSANISNTCT